MNFSQKNPKLQILSFFHFIKYLDILQVLELFSSKKVGFFFLQKFTKFLESGKYLEKRYFSGGTIEAVLSSVPFHQFRKDLASKFEDGTINFLSIISLQYGFQFLESSLGGLSKVHQHCRILTEFFIEKLSNFKHFNQKPLAVIYGTAKNSLHAWQSHQVFFWSILFF
jgi:hypothetical protein